MEIRRVPCLGALTWIVEKIVIDPHHGDRPAASNTYAELQHELRWKRSVDKYDPLLKAAQIKPRRTRLITFLGRRGGALA